MIKTLRITIIVTAILAVFFFVLSAAFGLRHDKEKEAFLAKPTATEIFKKIAAKPAGELESPLLKQAQAFALRINPPKPVVEEGPVTIQKVVEVPKFKLLGTSYFAQDPNKSMALIDEPGKGMHWVMASDKIDYLTVVGIEDGKIVYTDGKKTMEMFAEKPPETPGIIVISGPNTQSASGETRSSVAAPPETQAPVVADEGQMRSQPTPEEIKTNAEFIKKVIAEANEARETGRSKELGISKEEANELQGLGEFLKQVEQEQKQVEANSVKAEPNK